MRADDVFAPGGALSRALPGFEPREGQLEMARAVERALSDDRILVCEAGTGIGKTFAYLVPALFSGKRVIVSTATRALEDQIYSRDLPFIERALGGEVSSGPPKNTALVKGLSNYICLRRLNLVRRETAAATPSSTLSALESWLATTETGDIAELRSIPEGSPLLREVTSSSETRVGSTCKHYDECFVTRMKRTSEQADVIVVNHHVFFADLALKASASLKRHRSIGILPAYDAVIFDEAHQLEDIACMFFGKRVAMGRFESLCRDAEGAFERMAALSERDRQASRALLLRLRSASGDWFSELVRRAPHQEGRSELPPDLFSGDVLAQFRTLETGLLDLQQFAENHAVDEATAVLSERAGTLREDALAVVEPATHCVSFMDIRARTVSLGACPVDLGSTLRTHLFDKVSAAVLTSATLAAHNDFAYLRSRVGLTDELAVPVDEVRVPSPFDFKRRAIVYTPQDLPDVDSPDFTKEASERTAELVGITGGGAFVLCTSLRATRAMCSELKRRLSFPILLQGDAPKSALIERFRQDGSAVLVGSMSFWEGVDIPGLSLRLVIVDRLPFAVPSDPLVRARSRAIDETHGNSFRAYSVPHAALTLKQGFGRLLRTQDDYGVFALLDKRARTRFYGKWILGALPPTPHTDALDDVRAFWARASGS